MKQVLALIKEPMKKAYFKWIPDTLETYQQLVGGYIECVTLESIHNSQIIVICDEEGRIKDKPISAYIDDIGFVGTIVIVGGDGNGEFCSIPLQKYEAMQRFPYLWRMY